VAVANIHISHIHTCEYYCIMSAAPASSATVPTAKATTEAKTDSKNDVKQPAALEEDDEFEDFPVESTLLPSSSNINWGAS
jgi:hypothetical protein